MTTLRESLADYLRIHRQLGFVMPQDGRLLEGVVEFLERAGAERVTTELALGWARLPADAHPHYWRQWLGVARLRLRRCRGRSAGGCPAAGP